MYKNICKSETNNSLKISNFEYNKEKIKKQYAKFQELADEKAAERLCEETKNIYHKEASKYVGFGKAIKHYFENVELFVNPADIFADITSEIFLPCYIWHKNHDEFLKSRKEPAAHSEGAIWAGADFGHTMPDWNRVFGLGITGILNEAKAMLEKSDLSEEQKNFYLSVKYAYEGILIYIKRLAQKCEEDNSANSQFAAKNLYALANGKPSSLAEAMQLYFVYYSAQQLTQGNTLRSLGAVDDILYPFYKNDLKSGICTNEDVRELLRYFLFKWNSREILANIPFNLCTHKKEFTYLILEEYIKLNVPDPKIHIKCKKDIPDKVYKMVMESIKNGNNSFVFINDAVTKKALIKIGISEEDAQDYTLIGCYEPSASGKEVPCTLNGRINMPMAVETVLNGGKRFESERVLGTDFGESFETFEEFYFAVKKQLEKWCEIAQNEINETEKNYPDIIQAPVFSATYKSCMKKGKDAYAGGAEYNNSSVCIFGLGTVVDELLAIKKAVFEEKIISLHELKEVLKNNWSGSEELRKTMCDKFPKFGNNNAEADELAKDLTEFMSKCINQKPNGRGGVYRMGNFSIDWIIPYGKKLGASADGRKAGEPVSKNLSASVGMDKKGVTGVINSVTKLDFTNVPDGSVLDLHLHPTSVSGEDGTEVMISLLKTYFEKGGYAVHINVTDPKTLKAAQKNPEKYKNLQVRLCGWNVYFTDLDTEMQNNLIKSMEEK